MGLWLGQRDVLEQFAGVTRIEWSVVNHPRAREFVPVVERVAACRRQHRKQKTNDLRVEVDPVQADCITEYMPPVVTPSPALATRTERILVEAGAVLWESSRVALGDVRTD